MLPSKNFWPLSSVYFLKSFRRYLLGHRLVLRMKHSALWKTPLQIGQEARWLAVIEEVNFEVKHQSGSSHLNAADAMSRQPHQSNFIRANGDQQPTTLNLPADWSRIKISIEQHADNDLG